MAVSGVKDRSATRQRETGTPEPLNLRTERFRTAAWVGGLSSGLLLTLVCGVGIGAVTITPDTVSAVVTHHLTGWPASQSWSASENAIVWQVRLPRVLLGAAVGAGLAVAGVALQAMVRNVLADP